MRFRLLAAALAVALPSFAQQTATRPGTIAPNAVTVQGCNGDARGCVPIPISGTVNSAGVADNVSTSATYNANSVCATVPTAGQTGAGFFLGSGTLAATFTPSVSTDAVPVGTTSCTGGNYTATKFVDASQNTFSTISVTNPNGFQQYGIQLEAGIRCARVCTTAFTSGTATGNLVASTAQAPPPAAGADVTDRSARLLGKVTGSDNSVLATANTGRLQVDVVTGGGSNASVVTDGAAPPASDTMVAGSVTTAAPTYTTGQSKPISLTTAGALRTDSSGTTQPVNVNQVAGTGTATGNGTTSAGTQRVTISSDSTGQVAVAQWIGSAAPTVGQKAMASSIPVVPSSDWVPADSTVGGTTISAQCADGSINSCAANSTVSISLAGQTGASAKIVNSTFTCTLKPDASRDGGTTWETGPLVAAFRNADGTISSSLVFAADSTTSLKTIVFAGGSSNVRVRCSTAPTNSTVVSLRATLNPDAMGWGTVKAGSTLSAATDTATVTTLRDTATTKVEQSAAVTAAWTSATANDTAATLTTTGYGIAAISFNVSGGAITAGTVNFECSDTGSAPFYACQLARTGSATSETSYVLTGASQLWQVNVGAMKAIRVRLNPQITGAGTANISLQASSAAAGGGSSGGGGGGGTSSTFGSAFPATGTAVGAKDSAGTNMAPLNLDASGFLKVNVAAGGGSGGTSSSFAAAFPATGTAAGAKVSTSAPSLTNGNMEGLSLDTSGNLRVIAGSDGTTAATAISVQCADANINSCGANSTVQIATTGQYGASAKWVNSTLTGTLKPDCSNDGGTIWVPGFFIDSAGAVVTSIAYVADSSTVVRGIKCTIAGLSHVRIRESAAITNTTSVSLRSSTYADDGSIYSDGANNLQVKVNAALPTGSNTIGAVTGPSAAALALDASVTGLQVSQGSTTSGQKGELAQGAVTTSAPTYTTAQTSPLSLQTDGSLRVAVTAGGGSNASVSTTGSAPPGSATLAGGSVTTAAPTYTTGQMSALSLNTAGGLRVDGSGVTQPVSGTVTANGGTGTFNIQANASVNVAQIAGSTTTTLAAGEQKVGVEGLAASGAAKSGNPVQVGGVFNTTQPTVTTGQAVEGQATARGALIVATGVDTFTVGGTVTTTPPANASTNVAQFGGTNVVTGTGAGGAGIPRVTVSNDSAVIAAGNVASAATDSGNPLKIGGVFNTTQPTVTTGQRVDAQATARGELMIAKGVSGFSIDNTSFTANIGTTNGLALDATVAKLNVAQSAVLGSNTGPMMQGSVTTSAPTYTTGNVNPLSLTTAGAVRTDASATTQPVSGTVTTTPPANASTNVTQFGGTNVSTGTGASGLGIPRVTVANDSNILATQSGTWTVQPGNTANTTAWKVDGSAVTQPVSGTITANAGTGTFTTDPSDRAARLLGVVSASSNIIGKVGIDQTTPGTTNGVQVVAALPAGANNIGNTPIADGQYGAILAGVKGSAAAPKASDAALNVSISPNTPINIVNINAGTPLGAKVAGLTSAPVIQVQHVDERGHIAGVKGQLAAPTVTDQAQVVTQSPIPAPVCTQNVAISQTASTKLVSGLGGKRIYICSVFVVSTTAQSVSLTEGTGTTCGTAATALQGSTTVANGMALAANGGWTQTSASPFTMSQVSGDDLCLLQSGAGNVAGSISYTQF